MEANCPYELFLTEKVTEIMSIFFSKIKKYLKIRNFKKSKSFYFLKILKFINFEFLYGLLAIKHFQNAKQRNNSKYY